MSHDFSNLYKPYQQFLRINLAERLRTWVAEPDCLGVNPDSQTD